MQMIQRGTKTMSNLIFSPASEPQSQFLTSDSWLTIYGGEHTRLL